ncbi:MAG: OsmC family protein [Rickettsiales bacterium]|jgi:uncharacterized OsmC-like protein|nr:OsmC family protein [Rickettsiales bacterium]
MKIKKTIPFVLCFLFGAVVSAGYFYFPERAPSGAASPFDYPVKVSVREIRNRTLMAEARGHKIISDQPKEFGADDKGPTPPELLAASFGTCIAATIRLLASRENIQISDIKVEVEGLIDFAKAMGKPGKNRAGFQGLTAKISFDSTMGDGEKQDFISRVSEIGAALDTIGNKTPVRYVLLQ